MSTCPNGKPALTFTPSAETTVGVELELPVVDRASRNLMPGSPRILAACSEEGIDGVSAELMQSMLEIRTGICADVRGVRDELCSRLRQVRNVATSTGYDLALLASHPSARPNDHTIYPSENYLQLQGTMAWMVYHRVTFGLHVHVGVRSGDEAIWLINSLVQYLPHLIAASANSPFWQGVDTGLASSRCALYNLVTHAGVPQYFTDCLLADGDRLFAYRDRTGFKGLCFCNTWLDDGEREQLDDSTVHVEIARDRDAPRQGGQGVVVATQPLNREHAWHHLEPGELIVIQQGRMVRSSVHRWAAAG